MNIHNSPQYVVSTLESECKRLGIPLDFITDLDVYPVGKGGYCIPVTENGKIVGAIIAVLEGSNQSKTKSNVFHEAKHAEQYYKKRILDVEDINPVHDELEAISYEFKRNLEEFIHYVGKKVKSLVSK